MLGEYVNNNCYNYYPLEQVIHSHSTLTYNVKKKRVNYTPLPSKMLELHSSPLLC